MVCRVAFVVLLSLAALAAAQKNKTGTQVPVVVATPPAAATTICPPTQKASQNTQNATTAAPRVDPCTDFKQKITWDNLKKLSTGTYYINKTSSTWYEAKAFCEHIGSQLATFQTKEEMKLVGDSTGYSFRWFWVSASDIGHQMGVFFWADGTKVDALMWTGGEPNDFGFKKETCASLFTAPPKLRDYSCLDKSFFICEINPQLAQCA